MIRNYFKVAMRNLRKHAAYSVINLLGLSVGMAVAILILLFIKDELDFDTFYQNADRIFRLVETQNTPEGERQFGITVAPLGPAMAAEIPGVENYARLLRFGRMTVKHGENRFYEEFLAADPALLELFDFEFISGSPETALEDPHAAVMTRTAARKYFGDADPVGKVLETDRGSDFTVTAVIADPPRNTHLQFEILFSFNFVKNSERLSPFLQRWDVEGFTTYVLLAENRAAGEVSAAIPALLQKNQPPDYQVEKRISLQPLADIHFYSGAIEEDRNAGKSEIAYIYVFAAIAFFIILIACINYMNLATARSANRASEIGLRKVVGASRSQLVGQFLVESIIMTVLALFLAYVAVQNVLPAFNAFAEKELSASFFGNGALLAGLLLLTLLVGVISGSYPALYLSKIGVIQTLKRNLKAGSVEAWLRRGLVVTQFTLSIVLIIATLVALQQMRYVQNKHLGFNEEHLVVIDINNGGVRSAFAAMKHELANHPEVRRVSVSSRVPGEWKNIVELDLIPEGQSGASSRTMHFMGVDEDFLATFEVDLVAGRNFDPKMSTDTTAVLLNQAAAAALGWADPVGKTFRVPDKEYVAHVIGVVGDFHFRSLHEKIGPLILGHSHNSIQSIDYFTARVTGADIPATLDHLRQVHETYDNTTPFEFHFLDQQLENFYRTDRRVSMIFAGAASMAILIACMGLFGLAAFTAEQRTKEIGVRKVLGAGVLQLVLLLSKDFTRLVVVALVIAVPVAYYAMGYWLGSFAYRTELGVSIFVTAGLIALCIALMTVAYHAIKAALANPVDSLHYE